MVMAAGMEHMSWQAIPLKLIQILSMLLSTPPIYVTTDLEVCQVIQPRGFAIILIWHDLWSFLLVSSWATCCPIGRGKINSLLVWVEDEVLQHVDGIHHPEVTYIPSPQLHSETDEYQCLVFQRYLPEVQVAWKMHFCIHQMHQHLL